MAMIIALSTAMMENGVKPSSNTRRMMASSKRGFSMRIGRAAPQQKAQRVAAAERLRDHRGNGRAAHAHVQRENEHRGPSTMFITAPSSTENIALRAKPCAVTKEFMPVASRANTRAHHVPEKVFVRVGQRVFAGAEEHQHRPPERDDRRHQRHGENAQHHKAVGKDFARPFLVALAHADAHQRRAAQADQRSHGADHRHHRPAHAHARQRHFADLGNVADVHAVYDAVKHADELRQHCPAGRCGARAGEYRPAGGRSPCVCVAFLPWPSPCAPPAGRILCPTAIIAPGGGQSQRSFWQAHVTVTARQPCRPQKTRKGRCKAPSAPMRQNRSVKHQRPPRATPGRARLGLMVHAVFLPDRPALLPAVLRWRQSEGRLERLVEISKVGKAGQAGDLDHRQLGGFQVLRRPGNALRLHGLGKALARVLF